MTEPIPRAHLPVIADRFRTTDDPRMSRDKLVELVYGYGQHLDWRPLMQAIAEDQSSKFQPAARKLLDQERTGRRSLQVSNRLLTLDVV